MGIWICKLLEVCKKGMFLVMKKRRHHFWGKHMVIFSRKTCLPGQILASTGLLDSHWTSLDSHWTCTELMGNRFFIKFPCFGSRTHHFAKRRPNSTSFCLDNMKTCIFVILVQETYTHTKSRNNLCALPIVPGPGKTMSGNTHLRVAGALGLPWPRQHWRFILFNAA